VIFSRYQPGIGLATGAQPLLDPDQPLRILMAIAAPTDQEQLDLKREATHLQRELRHSPHTLPEGIAGTLPDIQVTILDQPGREQLTQALEQGQFQVFHFAGHSNLGAAGGCLYLVNHRTGLTETLSGDDLAGLLVNNNIRMAVFNSCRGAYTATADALEQGDRNLAEALVSRGIPAVLAMAERIPDDVALTLTRLFYRNLKQGYPADLSLSRARQGLISAYGSHQLYWALPILYLHPDFDGYLTPGDRTLDNPADYLVRLPRVYNAAARPPKEEPALPLSVRSGNQATDWDDLSTVVDEPEDVDYLVTYGLDEEELDEEELDEEEDRSVVADLVQKLTQQQPQDERLLLAGADETLLPDASGRGLEIYKNLPENPLYRQEGQPQAARSQETDRSQEAARSQAAARSQETADRLPTENRSRARAELPDEQYPGDATPIAMNGANYRSGQATPEQAGLNWRRLWQRWGGRSLLLPLGAVGVVAIALVGFWFVQRAQTDNPNIIELPDIPPSSGTPGLNSSNDFANIETPELTAIAIAHFNRGELADGEKAVTALLERNTLPEAEAALQAVPVDKLDDPTISFLRGRLAWQAVQVGTPNYYNWDDARRYWKTAAQGSPNTPFYREALGFAYYAEGNSRLAIQAWVRSLALLEAQAKGQEPPPDSESADFALPTEPLTSESALTAYAGIALALMQASTDLDPAQREEMLSKAVKLYQMVSTTNPSAFQEEALSKNWLWTETAIRDWQVLSTLEP
jgi:CHAT domain